MNHLRDVLGDNLFPQITRRLARVTACCRYCGKYTIQEAKQLYAICEECSKKSSPSVGKEGEAQSG